ncbi:MAG TPA: hypothetical protein VJ438_04385 [Candidatus Nanoarchaeia archaeon]|nr:hypothetical protein [Candidatus Nanoarchaeia archaeon]
METESDIIREIVARDIGKMVEERRLSGENALYEQPGSDYSGKEMPCDNKSKPLN